MNEGRSVLLVLAAAVFVAIVVLALFGCAEPEAMPVPPDDKLTAIEDPNGIVPADQVSQTTLHLPRPYDESFAEIDCLCCVKAEHDKDGALSCDDDRCGAGQQCSCVVGDAVVLARCDAPEEGQ